MQKNPQEHLGQPTPETPSSCFAIPAAQKGGFWDISWLPKARGLFRVRKQRIRQIQPRFSQDLGPSTPLGNKYRGKSLLYLRDRMLDEFQGREIPVGQSKEEDLAPRALRDGSHQLLGFQLPKST